MSDAIFWVVVSAIAALMFGFDAPIGMSAIAAIASSVMLLLMVEYAFAGLEALAKSIEVIRARVVPEERVSKNGLPSDQ